MFNNMFNSSKAIAPKILNACMYACMYPFYGYIEM